MLKILLVLSIAFFAATLHAATSQITAKSWLVADGEGVILESKNPDEVRSIASITKLMTAMVILDAKQDLDEFIKPHSRRNLLKLAVIKSNNAAADTLCKHYPGGYSECIKAMNAKAQDLGLIDTKFVDATGLGVMNISKATELIKIVIEAQKYPEIVEDSRTPYFHIRTKNTKLGFNNTNPIVSKRQDFVVSKTGYIRASGGCIVMMVDTAIGKRIIVLLGSKNTKTRIPEAEFIAKRH